MIRRPATLLCVVLLSLGFLAPSGAEAQSRSDRYTINVFDDDGTCRYQIANHADQDLFRIRPGGTVTVRTKGRLWVDVSVEDDPRGTPGARSQRLMTLRRENQSNALKARSAIGRSTEHKVRIQCCPSLGRRDECPRWVDAQPPSRSTGAILPRDAMTAPRGPSTEEPVAPSWPAGGPIMRVDEF